TVGGGKKFYLFSAVMTILKTTEGGATAYGEISNSIFIMVVANDDSGSGNIGIGFAYPLLLAAGETIKLSSVQAGATADLAVTGYEVNA
ncbi:unnamed protein product, partial [marine sediment metagenome]